MLQQAHPHIFLIFTAKFDKIIMLSVKNNLNKAVVIFLPKQLTIRDQAEIPCCTARY